MIHRLLIPELRGLKHCKLLVNRDLLAFNAHFFYYIYNLLYNSTYYYYKHAKEIKVLTMKLKCKHV